jgi:hypothetical protein
VQRGRINNVSLVGVWGLKPARQHIVKPRPQMVQVEIAVESLAAVQVGIRDRARAGDRHAEGVELVGVAHRARGVRREAHIAVAVVAVEGWCPRAAGELVLADALHSVAVGFRHRTTGQLVEHLGVTSWNCDFIGARNFQNPRSVAKPAHTHRDWKSFR